jgi:hypothetical protein
MVDYASTLIGGPGAAYKPVQADERGRLSDTFGLLRKRNRIVNPGMRIAQDRGTATIAVASGAVVYAVDQWVVRQSIAGLGLSAQQVIKRTPAGSPNRIRLTVTAGASANGAVTLSHPIEGSDVADLMFGTALARTISGRIGINAPAGTYTLGLRNGAANRFIGKSFTITPAQTGTDVVVPYTFPGDTAGTWWTDTSIGLELGLALASSDVSGTTAWASGAGPAVAGQTNGVATTNAVFEIFDAGLYEGVDPTFELPPIAEDLRACQRFYELFGIGLGGRVSTATNINVPGGAFRQVKRTTPSIAFVAQPSILEVDQGPRTASGATLNTYFTETPNGIGLFAIGGFSGLGPGNQVALTQSALSATARLI